MDTPMSHVELHRVISSDIGHVWEIVSNIQRYPAFMPSVQSVEILHGTPGCSTQSQWSVVLQEAVMEWTEVDTYNKDAGTLEFCQISGDLEMFKGRWQLRQVPSGTEIQLSVEFSIGIPGMEELLAPIAVTAIEENCHTMLDCIEHQARTT